MGRDLIETFAVPSRLGTVQGLVSRGPGSRWIWVLHGRGDTAEDCRALVEVLRSAMASGELEPASVAVPDGPWADRAHWWVDSRFDDGAPVESALLQDVLPAVERHVSSRALVGVSMGGAGALRWLLTRPDLFDGAVLCAPAVYDAGPPARSTVRTSGAFGVGASRYAPERYDELMSVRRLVASGRRDVRVAIVVGDEEVAQEAEDGTPTDLDVEAARLHARLKRALGITSSLRVVGGGHDDETWLPHLVDAATRAGLGPQPSA